MSQPSTDSPQQVHLYSQFSNNLSNPVNQIPDKSKYIDDIIVNHVQLTLQ